MNRIIFILSCVTVLSLSTAASAQVGRTYTEGRVTALTYLRVDYGRFDEYVEWLTMTWKPTMEAKKKAGLILDFKVFSARPKSPTEPNVILMITYPNMAGLDRAAEEEAVAEKVIGSADQQNKARVSRSQYRTVLGSELLREVVLR